MLTLQFLVGHFRCKRYEFFVGMASALARSTWNPNSRCLRDNIFARKVCTQPNVDIFRVQTNDHSLVPAGSFLKVEMRKLGKSSPSFIRAVTRTPPFCISRWRKLRELSLSNDRLRPLSGTSICSRPKATATVSSSVSHSECLDSGWESTSCDFRLPNPPRPGHNVKISVFRC